MGKETANGGISAAVLCSGPSFARFLAMPPRHDLYIGVNRMAEVFPCDWWAFLDVQPFEWYTPRRRADKLPSICTSDATQSRVWSTVTQRKIQAFHWERLEMLPTACPRGIPWARYSMLVAVVLADYLGADSITLYGCDWSGTADWDGTPNRRHEGRSRHRWNGETATCRLVGEWLSDHDVRLRRVTLNGTLEELNSMSKKIKDEATSGIGAAGPETVVDGIVVEEPAPDPLPTAQEKVRLRIPRRLGQEELEAGHLLGKVELYPPCASSQMLARLIEDGHASVTAD